ncbi:MAG: hypothetical protein A2176_13870 [Spirochaetes bacterium RBG_13_51_14]|nr:MAG: hypothetical protein A2176_13870 [Spirochaetes bacterium RBG_13_51_14]
MKGKKLLSLALAVPTVSVVIVLSLLFCSGGGGTLFGASGESPLRGDKVSDAVKVQDTFRKIFEINKHRVVYISTE